MSAGAFFSKASVGGPLLSVATYPVLAIPPDGGWGWVIVGAAFFSSMLVDGVPYSYGLFLEELTEYFHSTPTVTATANSVIGGFYFCFGPFSCALVNRFGFRIVGLVGGLTTALSFLAAVSTNEISVFLFSYGVIGGIGLSMMYAASIIAVGFYFERWRALATSLAATGASVGMLSFPLLFQYLEEYNWQFKFKVLAVVSVVISFFSLTYAPVKELHVDVKQNPAVLAKYSNLTKHSSESEQQYKASLFDRYHNTAYPTINELNDDEDYFYLKDTTSSSSSLERTINMSITTLMEGEREDSRIAPRQKTLSSKCKKCCSDCYKCMCMCNCTLTHNRPLYRDDIFYQASLQTLAEYKAASKHGAKPPVSYRMSVTRVRTQKDAEERKQLCSKSCPEAIKRVLITMLDVRLLKSTAFCFLVMSGFFSILGINNTYIYIVQRAEEKGFRKEEGNYILSIIGISNMLGRITFGVIASIPHMNALCISHICLYLAGIITIVSYYLSDILGHYIYSGIYGFLLATMGTLRTPIIVDLLTLKQLTNGLGLVLLFEGIGAFIGIPIAGLIAEHTHSYNNCYMFAGVMLIISAITLMLVGPLSKREKRKKGRR